MEKWFMKDFEVENKNPLEEAMRKWRAAVSIVKNPHRRFRMVFASCFGFDLIRKFREFESHSREIGERASFREDLSGHGGNFYA